MITTSTTRLRWPLERVLFALAGTMTLLSAALAATVSSWFLLFTALVGINQWLYVTVGACPASLVLGRLLGLQPCRSTAPRFDGDRGRTGSIEEPLDEAVTGRVASVEPHRICVAAPQTLTDIERGD